MSDTRERGRAGTRSRHPAGEVGQVPRKPPGRRSARFVLLGAMAMLLGLLGVVMVLSSSSVNDLRSYGDAWYHLKRQVIWFAIGLFALTMMMRIDYRRLRVLSQPAIIVAVGLLVMVLIPGIGISANGSARWIGVGPITFQPSEVAKLGILFYCADLLSRPGRPSSQLRLTLRPVLVVTATIGVLLMLEPDLGTLVIVLAIVSSLLFFSGTRLDVLAGLGVV
ncbi:MAG TPA: FtsW/RodA/SpoVE family cell cycle protein, partial [Acidimicrobiales bacterium]|nr:FtsW/RodA/SpoVE family cell cycle protein [Acidimicrobiales bacterium]